MITSHIITRESALLAIAKLDHAELCDKDVAAMLNKRLVERNISDPFDPDVVVDDPLAREWDMTNLHDTIGSAR